MEDEDVGVLSNSAVGEREVVSMLFAIVVEIVVLFVVVFEMMLSVVGVGRTSGAGVGEREEDLEEEELFGWGLVLGVELVVFVGFFLVLY